MLRPLAVLLLLAGVARAEPAAEVTGSAGVGAGFVDGQPTSAVDVRGDPAWESGALGLGARLRAVGDGIEKRDWDEVSDWIAIARYLVIRNRADRTGNAHEWRAALAAGPLADVGLGTRTIVDGYVTGAYAD